MEENTERWTDVVASELNKALRLTGAVTLDCYADDGVVRVTFADLRDAETMMAVGVSNHSGGPGSLYDRATSSCVTLTTLAAGDDGSGSRGLDEGDVEAALDAGWGWLVHPDMQGRRMNWHVAVDMPIADAVQVTANLNALRNWSQS